MNIDEFENGFVSDSISKNTADTFKYFKGKSGFLRNILGKRTRK